MCPEEGKKRPEKLSPSGLDKVAALLLSLPSDEVSKVFTRLDPSEVRCIVQRMATLTPLSRDQVEELYSEFVEQVAGITPSSHPIKDTETLFKKILNPAKVTEIVNSIQEPESKTLWKQLNSVSAPLLANFLKNEHPQTVALVLSMIAPQHTASILALFPEELALNVINRMLAQGQVQQEILHEVENSIKTQFVSSLSHTIPTNTYQHMADIFSALEPHLEVKFMNRLEIDNSDAASRIKALLFTFEDLLHIEPLGIKTLVQAINKSKLSIALKGASEAVRALFFTSLSERAEKLLRDEIKSLDIIKLREVDEAQQEILQQAKGLIRRGEIHLKPSAFISRKIKIEDH